MTTHEGITPPSFCYPHAVQAPKGARGAGQVFRIQENKSGFCYSHGVQALKPAEFCYSHAVQSPKPAGFCYPHAVQAPKPAEFCYSHGVQSPKMTLIKRGHLSLSPTCHATNGSAALSIICFPSFTRLIPPRKP